jgi:hypothetical protein
MGLSKQSEKDAMEQLNLKPRLCLQDLSDRQQGEAPFFVCAGGSFFMLFIFFWW